MAKDEGVMMAIGIGAVAVGAIAVIYMLNQNGQNGGCQPGDTEGICPYNSSLPLKTCQNGEMLSNPLCVSTEACTPGSLRDRYTGCWNGIPYGGEICKEDGSGYMGNDTTCPAKTGDNFIGTVLAVESHTGERPYEDEAAGVWRLPTALKVGVLSDIVIMLATLPNGVWTPIGDNVESLGERIDVVIIYPDGVTSCDNITNCLTCTFQGNPRPLCTTCHAGGIRIWFTPQVKGEHTLIAHYAGNVAKSMVGTDVEIKFTVE